MAKIGVLALQGDFAEHIAVLHRLATDCREVRLPGHLEGLDGLIIPGGESTTIARLLDVYDIREPLKRKVREGMSVWGTCAGMILLARKLVEDRPQPMELMDIEVQRNAYGRQVDSFEADIPIAALGVAPVHCIFIRAPKIKHLGPGVEVLGKLTEGGVVAIQQGKLLATAFHPELTEDTRFHEYFLSIVAGQSHDPYPGPD
ncbi:MAG: pyridoxal 5'-phosphate synthase glutaminase subunit PdxT [Chloroflexi bacterium]|nr:pyridoxal 5'-phosphate synthase glutaminase subunit PdxT [Chloroflexota bacterium]